MNRSSQTTFKVCKLCGKTVPLYLLQSHLLEVHDTTFLEYKELVQKNAPWNRQKVSNEKKTN